jgi:hypothetical protein
LRAFRAGIPAAFRVIVKTGPGRPFPAWSMLFQAWRAWDAVSVKPVDRRNQMTREMPYQLKLIMQLGAMLLLAMFVSVAQANDAGRIKVVKGAVEIERDGKVVPAVVGAVVRTNDTIVTGPNSTLSIDQFVFDSTTHQGAFDTTLKRGTLAAVSGKLVKERPESMRVKTPAAIMGVRGTEFLVRVAEVRD